MGRRWSSVKITCSPFGSVYVSYLISGTFNFKEVSAAEAKTEERVMASIPEKATRPTRMLDCASQNGSDNVARSYQTVPSASHRKAAGSFMASTSFHAITC